MDLTPEQYEENLLAELREWEQDIALMNSPLWEHMKTVFRLRREALMSLVMNDEELNAQATQRLKGSFRECEYFLTLADTMKEGAEKTVEKLRELEIAKRESQQEEQGEY